MAIKRGIDWCPALVDEIKIQVIFLLSSSLSDPELTIKKTQAFFCQGLGSFTYELLW